MDKAHEILESIINGTESFIVRGILAEGTPKLLPEP
jgi:hypothetical protein